jgi:glycosyltransferase involved in cell wall biosynthesis
MARQCPEVLFLLVGSTKRGLSERRAERLANVNVIPWQPFERSALYQRASDVLLIPPSSAPLRIAGSTVLPMKVFGYLAAGRPIFAPASADVRDVLDEHNAVLIDPDKPEMAVPTLRALLADPARMEAVAQGAKQTAESLTWECRAAKIEAFLHERLASHRIASTAQPQHPQPESVR